MTFKRIKDVDNKYGIDLDGENDYFVKIETTQENRAYTRFTEFGQLPTEDIKAYEDWNAMLYGNLGIYDDDVFYYFMADEKVPEVGETFELDGLTFERSK